MKPATVESKLRGQIGQRVRRLRMNAGLTQTGLGGRSSKDQSTVSKIEAGEYQALTIGAILDLAYGLGCQPEDIFEWPVGIMDLVEREPGRPSRTQVAA